MFLGWCDWNWSFPMQKISTVSADPCAFRKPIHIDTTISATLQNRKCNKHDHFVHLLARCGEEIWTSLSGSFFVLHTTIFGTCVCTTKSVRHYNNLYDSSVLTAFLSVKLASLTLSGFLSTSILSKITAFFPFFSPLVFFSFTFLWYFLSPDQSRIRDRNLSSAPVLLSCYFHSSLLSDTLYLFLCFSFLSPLFSLHLLSFSSFLLCLCFDPAPKYFSFRTLETLQKQYIHKNMQSLSKVQDKV